jgi:hypothetical protein
MRRTTMAEVDESHRDRGGPHSLVASLLDHLHDRLGRRREQHGYVSKADNTAKESIMDTQTELIGIMKDCGGPVSLCKGIVDRGRSPCGEAALVSALSKVAADASGEPGDKAFARLYESDAMVRKACQVAKAAEAAFDVTIVEPGDATYRTVNDTEQSEAYQTLQSLADKLHAAATGRLSREQAFARAFESNPELARKAHQTPVAPPGGAYPMPR